MPLEFSAPEKGLSNIRMHFAQSVFVAAMMNSTLVLPNLLPVRQNCNYKFDCHKDFNTMSKLDTFYDVKLITRELARMGVSVEIAESGASHAADMTRTIRFPSDGNTLRARFREMSKDERSTYWTIPGRICCTEVVPTRTSDVSLLRKANKALVASGSVRWLARQVISAMKSLGVTTSLHWRAEEDMVRAHALDKEAYSMHVRNALRNQSAVMVLGESPSRSVIEWMEKEGVHVYTKDSLLPRSKPLRGALDDVRALVDFEVGCRSSVFIGSPFSSFSVMVANIRALNSIAQKNTRMLDVDVVDKLAKIFSIHFPWKDTLSDNPCRQLLKLHPFGRRTTWSCPTIRKRVQRPL